VLFGIFGFGFLLLFLNKNKLDLQSVTYTLMEKAALINNISVDCVIFGFGNNGLKVLLTRRELEDPKSGEVIFSDYTLQGHHVFEGENLYNAANRVLKEKTGLENIYLEQFFTFGDVDRLSKEKDQLWSMFRFPDLMNHVVTVGYYALVDSSKVIPDLQHPETEWFPVDKLPELGFDHDRIIAKALDFLRNKVVREPIVFELLPEKFALSQLQNLYEAVLGIKLDKRNFRKKVAQMKYIIPLDEKQKGVPHKPAQVYIFSRDVYERTKRAKYWFSI